MPLDAVTLSALAAELRGELTGGKIEKIQQPQRDLVLLTVRTRSRGSQKLILSGGVGSARMHFTEAAFENPASPPMFCMLLRKHLLGSRITALEQPGLERVLTLEAEGYDELGNLSRKRLVLELIGRSTNLILVGPEGHILDCLRRVDAGMNPRRQLLPGLLYCFPDPQAKPDFFSAGPEKRRELLAGADRTVPGDKWLLGAFRGLSPLLCRELWYRAGEDWGASGRGHGRHGGDRGRRRVYPLPSFGGGPSPGFQLYAHPPVRRGFGRAGVPGLFQPSGRLLHRP